MFWHDDNYFHWHKVISYESNLASTHVLIMEFKRSHTICHTSQLTLLILNVEFLATCNIFVLVLRCQGMVFDAEKRVAKSGSYHKKCFTCVKCKHQLGAGDFTNGPDNEIYCVYCYRVNDTLI